MTQRITQQELESYLWGAAVLLRGLIDAGDYKQFIFPLLFYKRLCDVFDEETRTALAESGGDSGEDDWKGARLLISMDERERTAYEEAVRMARELLGAATPKPWLDWATLLRRTYDLDVLTCPCGGRLRCGAW